MVRVYQGGVRVSVIAREIAAAAAVAPSRRRSPLLPYCTSYCSYCSSYLSEAVQLQAARADGVHDRRVVDDLDLYPPLPRAQLDVRVRGRAKRVADHQETDVLRLTAVENRFRLL